VKRLSTGVLTALVAASLGLTAIGATSETGAAQGNIGNNARPAVSQAKIVAQASAPAAMESAAAATPLPITGTATPAMAPAATPATMTPVADFGRPPSGEIPILFNDHHVYSKPDRLTQNRVLAAIIRGNTILVPLRSMFEQMGATVAFNSATKTVDVNRPGSDVKVTVGKPEVIINGESRPLDVAPQIYKGAIVVPLRVLSEGMGAFVQWVPAKRLVVIRYLAAPIPTPPPTPEPTAPPTAGPTPSASPTPTPAKRASKFERFVVGDYLYHPKVYNELSPGNTTSSSFTARGAVEFPIFNIPWMLEGDFRSYRYEHYADAGATGCPTYDESCVNGIGTQGEVLVPQFQARDDDFDGRFGLKIADPRIYIGVGYLFRNSNYEGGAFAGPEHGLGGGIEKLPDLDQKLSVYFSIYYYPDVTTNNFQNFGNGNTGAVAFRILKYAAGFTFNLANSPIFLDLGFVGDKVYNKQNGYDATHEGPQAGLGIHF
jgi:hypothetical protein